MFGHNEHHEEENKLPEPDSNVVSSAPVAQNDDNGGYLDDVTPIPTTPASDANDPALSTAPLSNTTPTATDTATPDPTTPGTTAAAPQDHDQLLDIKQQALQQLTPLVGHLEQSPEERFRTTMMMIQASDNQDLIAAAYEAAQQITDEKVRAQALLDIVNEINYFTHSGANAA